MTQAPFKVDALQIEPGSGQTLLVTRDPTTGGLKFTDVPNPSGLLLSDLANLSTVSGVLVVGKTGTGAKYHTIQAAINAASGYSVVLVFPGTYSETLTINKDGITILGLGMPTLSAPADGPTVVIQAGVLTTPRFFQMSGVRVENAFGNRPCVDFIGSASSQMGLDGILFENCSLVAAAGGYALRGVAINYLTMRNCDLSQGHVSATILASQCARIVLDGCRLPPTQMDYDNTGVVPSDVTSSYVVTNCPVTGALQSTLANVGSLTVNGCPSVVSLALYGNCSAKVDSSVVSGALNINGTTSVTARGSSFGSVAGSGTLTTPLLTGNVTFAAVDHRDVTFAVPKTSTNYQVSLDCDIFSSVGIRVVNKTTTGFRIEFSAPQSTAVYWTVVEEVPA